MIVKPDTLIGWHRKGFQRQSDLVFAAVVAVAGLFVALGLNRDTPVQHLTAKVERDDIHDVVVREAVPLSRGPSAWSTQTY